MIEHSGTPSSSRGPSKSPKKVAQRLSGFFVIITKPDDLKAKAGSLQAKRKEL